MKSRTSSCERTLFKKNLTRFAPFWVIYTLCLLMGLILLRDTWNWEFYFPLNVAQNAREMALVNFLYAPVVAQLIFGDLYDLRMCSGLHALPMRREAVFGINLLSGLWFSLIPTAVMTGVMLPFLAMSNMVDGWQIGLWWFLAANLEYFFFYALAVFCTFCVGSRFAMAVVYGIGNFWSMMVYFLVDSLVTPLFEGVETPFRIFSLLCPVARITDNRLLYCENTEYLSGTDRAYSLGHFRLDAGWSYLLICVGVGFLLLGVALILYRRRKLECAGDFSAFPCLKPPFLLLLSLGSAAAFQVVCQFLVGSSPVQYAFSFAGLIVGWFAGRMVLDKTLRVFGKRSWAGLGILVGALGLTFLLCWMDPLNIEGRIPQNVQSVSVFDGYRYHYGAEEEDTLLTDPGDIDLARRLHALALEDRQNPEGIFSSSVSLTYYLENGRTMKRSYSLRDGSQATEIAGELFSRPAYLYGKAHEDLDFVAEATLVWAPEFNLELPEFTKEELEELRLAILADCAEGHMAGDFNFHRRQFVYRREGYDLPCWSLCFDRGNQSRGQYYVQIFADSRHSMEWLRQQGVIPMLEAAAQEYWERYYR